MFAIILLTLLDVEKWRPIRITMHMQGVGVCATVTEEGLGNGIPPVRYVLVNSLKSRY